MTDDDLITRLLDDELLTINTIKQAVGRLEELIAENHALRIIVRNLIDDTDQQDVPI